MNRHSLRTDAKATAQMGSRVAQEHAAWLSLAALAPLAPLAPAGAALQRFSSARWRGQLALFRALLLALSALWFLCSCEEGNLRVFAPEALYTSEESMLFDDQLTPELFGSDRDGERGDTELRFQSAARRADGVYLAQVETLSRTSSSEGELLYHLTLKPMDPPLAGVAGASAIPLTISMKSPVFPWLEAGGTELLGKRLIILVRRYGTHTNEIVHFRSEPDSAAVRAAISRARSSNQP